VFTALNACCEEIFVDFNGVFTAFAALTTPTISVQCDFSSVFTALADLNNTLTICCDTVINDLNGTFTVLANLNCTVTAGTCDLTGVYTLIGNTGDFPAFLPTCSTDVLATTTFDVIQWLKAIYLQLIALSLPGTCSLT
jgi:hypothetical protein